MTTTILGFTTCSQVVAPPRKHLATYQEAHRAPGGKTSIPTQSRIASTPPDPHRNTGRAPTLALQPQTTAVPAATRKRLQGDSSRRSCWRIILPYRYINTTTPLRPGKGVTSSYDPPAYYIKKKKQRKDGRWKCTKRGLLARQPPPPRLCFSSSSTPPPASSRPAGLLLAAPAAAPGPFFFISPRPPPPPPPPPRHHQKHIYCIIDHHGRRSCCAPWQRNIPCL